MALAILAAHSPRWSDDKKRSIDISLVTNDGRVLPHTATAGSTLFKGDDLFQQAVDGEFGPVAAYAGRAVDLDAIAAAAREQRILRVHIAYGGPEKRMSLYGYLGQLNAYAAQRELTAAEALDRETLVAAAEWEQKMLDAMGQIIARADINYIASNDAWPQMSDGLSVSLAALADAS